MDTMAGPTVYLDPPIKDLIPLVTALLALLHGEILQVEFNKFRYLVPSIEKNHLKAKGIRAS